jgi:hypothetical protein
MIWVRFWKEARREDEANILRKGANWLGSPKVVRIIFGLLSIA